jgi:predicted CoA-binding protein
VVAIPGIRTFWAQLGLNSPEAVEIVTSAGLTAVMDRCLKIEHARFCGGLHQAGFDTGVISSRRRPLL